MKILLVRLDGIGDALACTPLIAALRAAGHRLGVALSDRNAGIFARSAFEWTHELVRRPWPAHGHAPAGVAAFTAAAAGIGYDLALVASEEMDAYELARAAAPRRVGFSNGWEKPLKSLRIRSLVDRAIVRPASPLRVREHEVVTLFRLSDGLTGETEPTRRLDRLRPLVLDDGLIDAAGRPGGGAPYLAFQLTRKWTLAGIGVPRLAGLIRRLREVAFVRLLISGAEAQLMHEVGDALGTDAAGVNATVYEGADGLRAWKRAIGDAAVLVTPDTGAAHVAGMLGTPCVDVFAPSPTIVTDMFRWTPWAARARTLVAGDDGAVVAAASELLVRDGSPEVA